MLAEHHHEGSHSCSPVTLAAASSQLNSKSLYLKPPTKQLLTTSLLPPRSIEFNNAHQDHLRFCVQRSCMAAACLQEASKMIKHLSQGASVTKGKTSKAWLFMEGIGDSVLLMAITQCKCTTQPRCFTTTLSGSFCVF
jgi:hypothetical protein